MHHDRLGYGLIAVTYGLGVISFFNLPATGLEKPDFSGTWVFNAEKSKLRVQARLESGTFTIDHKEPQFRLSRVFVVGGKPDSHSYALSTDGKEEIRKEGGRTSYSRLYWDGDVLVFDVRYVMADGRQATNVVRYSLRDNGLTFVAEEKFRGPVLKYDNLWVADRKKQETAFLPLP